jgi:hypothetical protein
VDQQAVEEWWEAFRQACGVDAGRHGTFAFGDSAREVDAAFAWDEGEGDRSVAYWLDAHRRFFARRCAQLGVAFSDEVLTVFERFELVWPRAPDPER